MKNDQEDEDHFDLWIGLDWSLSSPALTVYSTKDDKYDCFYWHKKQQDVFAVGQFRFHQNQKQPEKNFERTIEIQQWLVQSIKSISTPTKKIFALFEGISYGSVGRVCQLAENLGVSKFQLLTNFNSVVKEVSPKSVKKFATGNGSCDKLQMYEQWYKTTNIDLTELLKISNKSSSPIQDIVDSYWIVQYAINNRNQLVKGVENESKAKK
jgi:hypothetical protein